MKAEILEKLFSISLKTRILRVWQKSNSAHDQEFSERELLTLELINDFTPITEKGLCKIFGIPFSSLSEMIKKLSDMGLIKSERARGKPLALTHKGVELLKSLKQRSAIRFGYLFESFSDQDCEQLVNLFNKIDKNAERCVQQFVFGRYETTSEEQNKK